MENFDWLSFTAPLWSPYLVLHKEIVKQMRWHKEGECDSEDPDIMPHPTDTGAWEAQDRFDPEFARDRS
jgi:hypothetical protein